MRSAVSHAQDARVSAVWEVLHTVLDPEVPAVSVCDLGIVRDVIVGEAGLEIVLTPTYSGCPATEVIESDVLAAIDAAGLGPALVILRRAPAWTTDWISASGREKLRDYGIAPPIDGTAADGVLMKRIDRLSGRSNLTIACPRCGSTNTEKISQFGSTPCKASWRCEDCLEPFDYFKIH